jgi:acyl-CoA synthetase (AMP-forming)/AMP-acid ligase II
MHMRINSHSGQWQTVPEIVLACARHRPDVTVLAGPADEEITAATLLERTRQGAEALAAKGLRHGQFAAIDTVSMNWSQVAVAYLSTVWLGAVAVLVMSEASERAAVSRVGVTVLISATGRTLANAEPVSVAQLRTGGGADLRPAARRGDLLDIVFTSGTTGEAKPVASTHAQWAGLVRPEIVASRARRVVTHSGIAIALSGGLHGVMLSHLARGVTSIWAPTAADILDAGRRRPPDELHLTPYSARALAGAMDSQEDWAERVIVIRIVGGPVPAPVAGQLARIFPRARMISLYGLTEGGAALCVKVVNSDGHQDSIGRPAHGTELRVIDSQGRELPPGEVGEIAVRVIGQAPLAYFKDEPLTRDSFPDGWARTGDLGFLAGDGDIRLVGRHQEMIFMRAGRVRPESVEEVLSRRLPPDVEFVVAGLATEGSWDRIAAFVAGDPESPAVAETRRQLAEMRGPFRPALVRVVPQIPRGPFGKPLRRLLIADLTQPDAEMTK